MANRRVWVSSVPLAMNALRLELYLYKETIKQNNMDLQPFFDGSKSFLPGRNMHGSSSDLRLNEHES